MSARGAEEFAEFGLKPPRDEFAEKNLISWGIDPDNLTVKDPVYGWTAWHHACKSGMLGMLRWLDFKLGGLTSPDESDRYGVTPLMLACYYGNDKCAYFVMSKGASITARSIQGMSVLEAACHGCAEVPGFRSELANAIVDSPCELRAKKEARKFLEDLV
mmetsp:Transcript_22629/g.46994  ORF Transcript_22629/g.46994 Transcript_22629/m.46994 type:complete len:160 (-) Transcript_22629:151-630(-)